MAKLGISLIYISGSALQPHNRLTCNFSLPSHYILSRTKSNKNTKTISYKVFSLNEAISLL